MTPSLLTFLLLLLALQEGQSTPMAAGLKHRIRPNHFLVQLKPTAALDKHLFWLQTVTFPSLNANPTMGDGMESAVLGHVYPNFGVYSIRLTLANTGTAMAILLSDSDVQAIEPDQIISILDFDGSKTSSHYGPSFERQTNVSNWGLSRISHHLLSSSLSRKSFPYFPSFSGNNVTVYVIDTGINVNHADLHPDRVRWGTTVPKNDQNDDGHGHGTHVSGIIAGQTFGVAKNALLVAVKVLDSQGMGTLSDVLKGIEWVLNDSISRQTVNPGVVNMSLGGGKSAILEAAVDKCITTGGLVFVAAAGNDGLNACDYSPAGSLKAITVGATSISDRIAFFSNHGNCTDIFAPGVDITSSWIGNAMAEKTISGTSMAAPFVSGIAAILLSQETTLRLGVLNNCERIKAKIVGQSTKHIISDMPVWAGGRNRLLFAGSEAETEEDRLLGTHEETNIIKDL